VKGGALTVSAMSVAEEGVPYAAMFDAADNVLIRCSIKIAASKLTRMRTIRNSIVNA
jgi:hypothetical protein